MGTEFNKLENNVMMGDKFLGMDVIKYVKLKKIGFVVVYPQYV